MGGGSFSARSFATYSINNDRTYDTVSNRITSDYIYTSSSLNEGLNPLCFDIRECVNSDEHPNTIPVILGLDVTGSMGAACEETAKALGTIVANLYENIPDVEFCIMGIGDLECDRAPIQMSQFESDVRIAKALDDLYMEHGGGGNGYESYTAAWYMGLKHTKLDCFDKQGRKGIIITMGDEPLNPRLYKYNIKSFTKDTPENDIETSDLYDMVTEKFDVYHIAIDDRSSSYSYYKSKIEKSIPEKMKPNYKVSTIQELGKTILDCINNSVNGTTNNVLNETTENGEIKW